MLPLSLPALQQRLDALGGGEELTVAASDCQRLFGPLRQERERLAHFARGHGCSIAPGASAIVFRKTGPGAEGA